MSLFARPTVTLAIVFGCFVVLIPRILLPYFRPRPVYRTDDRMYSHFSTINSIFSIYFYVRFSTKSSRKSNRINNCSFEIFVSI